MRAGYAVTPGGVTDLVARRGRDGAVLDVAAAANDGGVGVDVRVNRGG